MFRVSHCSQYESAVDSCTDQGLKFQSNKSSNEIGKWILDQIPLHEKTSSKVHMASKVLGDEVTG